MSGCQSFSGEILVVGLLSGGFQVSETLVKKKKKKKVQVQKFLPSLNHSLGVSACVYRKVDVSSLAPCFTILHVVPFKAGSQSVTGLLPRHAAHFESLCIKLNPSQVMSGSCRLKNNGGKNVHRIKKNKKNTILS